MSQGHNHTTQLLKISEHFDAVLRAVPCILYVINQEGHLLYASDKLLEAFSVANVHEVTGNFYDHFDSRLHWMAQRGKLLEQTDRACLLSQIDEYDVLEPPVTDTRGITFFYEATRKLLKTQDGKVEGLVVCLVDVTARRLLELEKTQALGAEALQKDAHRPYPPNIHRDPAKPPRVLLIEDNLLAQQSTLALLESLECHVDVAVNEPDLIKLFQLGKYDFVLMDIGLEGTTGYLLAKRIREEERGSGYCVPIIALTGFDADIVKTDCDYYFMEGAISKPLSIEASRQLIQRYVHNNPILIKGMKSLKLST